MLKRLYQRWNNFVRRHIACWPEEFNPHAPQEPLPDTFSLQKSVNRFYNSNPSGFDYLIAFDPQYDSAISLLRQDGWPIELNINGNGEAFYLIRKKETLLQYLNY